MDEEKNIIDDIFRNALKDYKEEPSEKVWENIKANRAVKIIGYKTILKYAYVAGALIFIAAIIFISNINNKQSTESIEHLTKRKEQQTVNNQQSTVNNKQQTVNSQQSALSKEQQTVNSQQPSLSKEQQTVTSQQSSLSKEQQTVSSQQPSLSKEQQTVNSQQPSLSKEQQTVTIQQSSLSKEQQTLNSQQSTVSKEQQTVNSQQSTASKELQTPNSEIKKNQETDINKRIINSGQSSLEISQTTNKKIDSSKISKEQLTINNEQLFATQNNLKGTHENANAKLTINNNKTPNSQLPTTNDTLHTANYSIQTSKENSSEINKVNTHVKDTMNNRQLDNRQMDTNNLTSNKLKSKNLTILIGMNYTPEYFTSKSKLLTNKNDYTNSTDLSLTFVFNDIQIRTGLGISFHNTDNWNYSINYNKSEQVGSYNKVDSVSFRVVNNKVKPTYYTSERIVYGLVNNQYNSEININYTYLQIPLVVGYKVDVYKRLSFSINAGIIFSNLISTKGGSMIYPDNASQITYIEDNEIQRNKTYWNYLVNVSMNYCINRRISLNIEPTYKSVLGTIYSIDNTQLQKPYTFGIRTGINFKF